MPPVLFFNAPRDCYRDVIVDKDELYITRAPVGERPRCIQRPAGVYNVRSMLEDLPEPYRKPSMVVCQWDCESVCLPCGLSDLDCPKVLLVTDTHHMRNPLSRAVRLAISEPWDLVVIEFNRQHCHWFAEAGVKNVAWIPCFTISPYDIPPPTSRTSGVTFAGSISSHHVYRRHVIHELMKRGLRIEVCGGTREFCANVHNSSLVSLNVSLNGDFNLRNFEIAAAGGCGLTDVNLEGGGEQDLDKGVAGIREILENPERSLEIGRDAYAWYWANHSPAHKIAELHACLAGKKTWYDEGLTSTAANVWDRIAIYENIQQLVLEGRIHWDDFKDLPRWSAA